LKVPPHTRLAVVGRNRMMVWAHKWPTKLKFDRAPFLAKEKVGLQNQVPVNPVKSSKIQRLSLKNALKRVQNHDVNQCCTK
jgi:hypothetical protein